MIGRRDALQALAALASARWAEEGIDFDRADEWGDLSGGIRRTGEIDAAAAGAVVRAPFGTAGVDRENSSEATVTVAYDDTERVRLSTMIEAGEAYADSGTELDPDDARELAVALYQASEELEAWTGSGANAGGDVGTMSFDHDPAGPNQG